MNAQLNKIKIIAILENKPFSEKEIVAEEKDRTTDKQAFYCLFVVLNKQTKIIVLRNQKIKYFRCIHTSTHASKSNAKIRQKLTFKTKLV